MEENITREGIMVVVNKTLAFIANEVGQNPPLINLVLDEAQNQDAIEDRLWHFYVTNKEVMTERETR